LRFGGEYFFKNMLHMNLCLLKNCKNHTYMLWSTIYVTYGYRLVIVPKVACLYIPKDLEICSLWSFKKYAFLFEKGKAPYSASIDVYGPLISLFQFGSHNSTNHMPELTFDLGCICSCHREKILKCQKKNPS
jgi:hypothetical protein